VIQCPVCLNNDQIRKVSSIVGSGSTTGYTTGWVGDSSYSVRHFSQNSLASQLSYEHPWDPPGCLIFIGAIYALAAFGPDFIRFLTGVPVVLVVCIFIMAKEWERGILKSLFSLKGWISSILSGLAIMFLFAGSFYGVTTFLAGASLVAFVVLRKNYLHKNREKHARELENWHQLYYCFRDDVVFHPGTGRYGPPETAQLLTQEE
jgi:hypothetical protein